MTNPTAAILIIGNEILSGRTNEANIQFLCHRLAQQGIYTKEARIVPDEEEMIIPAVQFLASTYTYVFTTGGIGATHDDITAACLAKAFHLPLIPHEEAYKILHTYYGDKFNDVRARMALMPEGAHIINNPISAAPGFQINNVFALAGIPLVMQAMFDNLSHRLQSGTPIIQKTVTCSIAENNIADELALLQRRYPDVEIGSYPYFLINGSYGVNLVIRGIDPDAIDHVQGEIVEMVRKLGAHPTFE